MNQAAMQFDNHDERIKYYELLLERDLDDLPQFLLPDGYRFGFVPLPQNARNSRDGWRIIKALTNHAALDTFDCAAVEEIISK